MHRIDGQNNVNDRFVGGDPVQRTDATVVTADWLNAVQEEIANAIEDAQTVPRIRSTPAQTLRLMKNDNTQLREALRLIRNALPPIGSIVAFTPYNFTSAGPTQTPHEDAYGFRGFGNLHGEIPDNWRICLGGRITDNESPFYSVDNNNNANGFMPDLSDGRFLQGLNVGAYADYAGGFNSLALSVENLPGHSHGIGAHTHDIPDLPNITGDGTFNKAQMYVRNDRASAVFAISTTHRYHSVDATVAAVPVNATVPQSHDVIAVINLPVNSDAPINPVDLGNTDATGRGDDFENRPQYLSCYYIMRIK